MLIGKQELLACNEMLWAGTVCFGKEQTHREQPCKLKLAAKLNALRKLEIYISLSVTVMGINNNMEHLLRHKTRVLKRLYKYKKRRTFDQTQATSNVFRDEVTVLYRRKI